MTKGKFQSDSILTLHEDLAHQGIVVADLLFSALQYFLKGKGNSKHIEACDIEIDKVDIEIERRSVKLLSLNKTSKELRNILTIVKVNNELERIADRAVQISSTTLGKDMQQSIPDTFEVVANSVIGLVRESVSAFKDRDAARAELVLKTDDAAGAFDQMITREIISLVHTGNFPINIAINLSHASRSLQRISDHCTNICEQVIYVESGMIVRHSNGGWTEPIDPDA